MAGEPILIVDDNPTNLKVARVTLEAEGYQIRVATDGNEALAVLAEFRPALILMDIQLPGIDGLELTRRLKAAPATRDIHIIAVTAYAMKGDEEKAVAAGCDGDRTKPLDPMALPAIVASHIRSSERALSVSVPKPAAPSGTVLVIEDNPITRKMIRVALDAHGYRVAEAADGTAALARIAESAPSLVLQDLVLPDIDGLELVVRLREKLGVGVPILCLTGFLSRLDEIQAVRGGFSAVLLKPVDPIELIESVRAHLGDGQSRAAAFEGGRQILVVDDDPLQRKLAQFYLTNAGFRVHVTADGGSALREAATFRPDAIVSDVLMPTMDGFQFALLARRVPSFAHAPIVLVSSHYIEEADRQLALKVGARVLVQRTPEWDGVIGAVNEALRANSPTPVPDLGDLDTGEHSRRILWQLERQATHSTNLAHRCTVQAAQLAVLAGTAEALAKNQRVNGVLGDVLAACLDMAGISKGALYLVDPRGQLMLRERIGFADTDLGRLQGCFGQDGLIHRILDDGKVIAVPSKAIPGEAGQQLLIQLGVPAALIVPVVWASEVKGALLLGARTADLSGDESIAFARVLGLQMAQAIGLAQTFNRLTLAEQRYRTLMEGAHDAVCVLTPGGIVVEVNRKWEELLSLDREQIVGHHLTDFAAVEWKDAGEVDTVAPLGGASRPEAVRVQRSDGSVALLEISKVSMEISGEQVVFAIGRDVTEQTRERAQLMTSDRMASVGLLASGVAHEINNPLAAVLANLELAESEIEKLVASGVVSNEVHEEIKDAREAADRVRQVARDLKIFSRAEDDNLGAIDLQRVLESSLRMARTEIRHRAHLVTSYGDVPPVMGNESRLGQAFLNLIVNAAQAIQEGEAETNEVRVSLARDGERHVVVEIGDTGAGIAPEALKQLFTPFFTTKPSGVGTGLGLSICRRIIAAAGGEITVDSRVGVGTTFRVRLPAAEGASLSEAPTPSPASRAGRRGRVLIVDDEPMLLRTLERTLAADHQVIPMTSAREALDLIAGGQRFDLILCDLMMPQVTGIELHAALVVVAPEQAQRMVFVTGGAFTPRGRAFLDRVPNLHVDKPFDAQRLRALVADQINGEV